MKLSDFDYTLPESLIAQHPAAERTGSRLMVLDAENEMVSHHAQFSALLEYLKPRDVLVMNNTQVVPARLYGHKETGGKIEVLVERLLNEDTVLAHIKASHAPKVGAILHLADRYKAELIARHDDLFELKLDLAEHAHALEVLDKIGEIPLPPYIEHKPEAEDLERYQTVYAQTPGAVAAPTAGLHFDDQLLKQIQALDVQIVYLTLHVGAGTFQPVRVDNIDDHQMHFEWMEISQLACDTINDARAAGGRVIAVGSTSMRSLESAWSEGKLHPMSKETNLFITPGYQFKAVDLMLTNFHLPKSSLMMLVSAFAGHAFTMHAYQEAVEKQYRFFSYGDAMLIHPK